MLSLGSLLCMSALGVLASSPSESAIKLESAKYHTPAQHRMPLQTHLISTNADASETKSEPSATNATVSTSEEMVKPDRSKTELPSPLQTLHLRHPLEAGLRSDAAEVEHTEKSIGANSDNTDEQNLHALGRFLPAEVDRTPHDTPWPNATALRQQLISLETIAEQQLNSPFELMVSNPINPKPTVYLVEWIREMNRQLDSLQALPSISHPAGGSILDRLITEAKNGYTQAELLEDEKQRTQTLCTAYAVTRRAEVWQAIWLACQSEQSSSPKTTILPNSVINAAASQLTEVHDALADAGDSKGWHQFLLLEDLKSLFESPNANDNTEELRIVAQRVLTRIERTELSDDQRRLLETPSIATFISTLRPLASSAVDYVQLLKQIEQQEINSIDQNAVDLADSLQNLRYSANPADQRIAEKLDVHYRNANFRVAVSSRLINRLLPESEPMTVPIRTRAMGTNIRGESQIESAVKISLEPSNDQWNMVLQSMGDITTLSTGQQSVVEIHTTGKANFESGTKVQIGQGGVTYDSTAVDVSGRLRLRKIESELDDYPILGGFVRTVAERRFQSMASEANRISNRTVKNQIRNEIDQTLDQHTSLANEKLEDLVIQPLVNLQLAPHVTEMRTTDEMLLGRFRVAGEWQMAAFTPRPRAPQDSLVNVQIHQSAINNTLEQLLPSGEAMPIDQILRRIVEAFGQKDWETPEDMPEDVEVRFSRSRPVSVEIVDGKVMLTLQIVQLKRGRAVDLRNVIIKAAYRPEINGLHAYLVRDGHLSITGPNMSMRKRLPARTIFNKVLSTNHSLPITVAGLEEREALRGLHISQLDLERGWIGLALSEGEDAKFAVSQ